MKYVFLNLKRFDIPSSRGGINRLCAPKDYGHFVMNNIKECASIYSNTCFVAFFPEAHIINANDAAGPSGMQVGCQGVLPDDTSIGGPFGAFTTFLTANAAISLGCKWSLIGHCEERRYKNSFSCINTNEVNSILNAEIKCAINAGLNVLYCIGEKSEEIPIRETVLKQQLTVGLEGVDLSHVVIAYEPIWSIGPGKTPPARGDLESIIRYIKSLGYEIPVVYGGGLKLENAKMLASIEALDGGLIALTDFSDNPNFSPDSYRAIVDLYLNSASDNKNNISE